MTPTYNLILQNGFYGLRFKHYKALTGIYNEILSLNRKKLIILDYTLHIRL